MPDNANQGSSGNGQPTNIQPGGSGKRPPEVDITANPNREGLYKMLGPQGPVRVPFSNVYRARSSGYQLLPDDSKRFAKDWAAAPGQRNMIVPHESTFLERARDTVANSGLGYSLEQTMPRVADALHLHPSETVYSPTYASDREQLIAPQYLIAVPSQDKAPNSAEVRAYHLARGIGTGLGQLTSGKNLAIAGGIAATGGALAPLLESAGPVAAGLRLLNQGKNIGLTAMGAKGVIDDARHAYQEYKQGNTNQALEDTGSALPNAALLLPSFGEPIRRAGEAMQRGGERLINWTTAARDPNMTGAGDAGAGYFQAGFGPSASMDSIGKKALGAADTTAATMQSAAKQYADTGELIPYGEGAAPILNAIDEKRRSLTKTSRLRTSPSLDEFEASWQPTLEQARARGGFLPDEYAVEHNESASHPISSDDKFRTQALQGMGDVLQRTIPDIGSLPSQYRNLMSLQRAAESRPSVSSSQWIGVPVKLAPGLIGAGGGALSHGWPGSLMGAGLGLLTDTVPSRTGIAAGLHYGGQGLSQLGTGLLDLFPPLVSPPDEVAAPDRVSSSGYRGVK